MTRFIDLNADLGEGCPWDAAVLEHVSSTSIGCGAHAGDPDAIRATLAAAAERGTAIGAHPGYADREGFGRREFDLPRDAVRDLVVEQVERLRAWAGEFGLTLRFLKPHGALYNQAQRDETIANGLLDAAERLALPVLGQPGSTAARIAAERGVRFLAEGFPDRRYLEDGRLVPRTRPDACLHAPEEIRANVESLLARRFDTLCVHGDDPGAANRARFLREFLTDRGWTIRSLA